MKILELTRSDITIDASCRMIDTGKPQKSTIHIQKNTIVHYTLVALAEDVDVIERIFLLEDDATLDARAILIGKKHLTMTSEALANHVKSEIKILAIATDDAEISVEGIARVDAPYREIVTRVDQTNILVGENTRIRGVPRLEIATDDVEGGHSCTIHRMDRELLFYLESRGLEPDNAEILLLNTEILRHLANLTDSDRRHFCQKIWKKWG